MITLHTCRFNRPPQNHKPFDHITHADSTDHHRSTSHMITLHTCGFNRPQNHKPYDHITHMQIQQTTTEPQAIYSHYTHADSTDHRSTSHMIALHTCRFNRPQKHKPYDHITHMRIQQTSEAQAI